MGVVMYAPCSAAPGIPRSLRLAGSRPFRSTKGALRFLAALGMTGGGEVWLGVGDLDSALV